MQEVLRFIRLKCWRALVTLLLGSCSVMGYSHDLGVYARVWSISEVNIKQVIAKQLHGLDIQGINSRLKSKVSHVGQHLASHDLPLATKTMTHYVDPSVALNRDIIVRGRIIYHKGTWVNPLHWVRPHTNLLFFDGQDKAQVALATQVIKTEPAHVQLVMIAGNPVTLSATLHTPVFYATQKLIKRFHIQAVPTLLGVGQGKHRYALAVSTLAAPYSVVQVKNCWRGCLKNVKN